MFSALMVLTPIALCAVGYFLIAQKAGASILVRVGAGLVGAVGFIALFLFFNQMIEVVTRNSRAAYRLLMTIDDVAFIVIFSFIPALIIIFLLRSVVRNAVTPNTAENKD